MVRKTIVLALAVLLSISYVAVGQETQLEQEKKLGVTFDLTYVSKWLSKGAQGYGQQGGLFETVNVDLYGSGFGFEVTHRSATSSGYVNSSRFDYRPYYKNKFFKGTPFVTNYNISVGYEHYYKVNSSNANTTWEWVFAFAWPELLGHGFVPKYIAHYEYPAHNNHRFRNRTGWVHRFILEYGLNVAQLSKPINLSAEIAYTDGLGGAAHDWSYFTLGMSTGFKIAEGLTFTPGLYHQISMDKSVCRRKDVTYGKLSMKYKF